MPPLGTQWKETRTHARRFTVLFAEVRLDNFDELGGKDHGHALSLDPELVLEVAKEVTKVDVKHLAVGLHHDVVVVAITDALK